MKKKITSKTRVNKAVVALDVYKTKTITYIKSLDTRKSVVAFNYVVSNKPANVDAAIAGVISQRNMVAIDELINHVLTAQKLGYETQMVANAGILTVVFTEKIPQVPYELRY
jgi:hypothetical protein